LAASGSHITTLPTSTLRTYGERFALKALPINLPDQSWPAVIVTLKNRTLSPVVEHFIQHVHDFARTMRGDSSISRRKA
jgi:DNA-binding transcriptional LysR family regulator